jgi:hypothetical protein
MSFSWIGRTFSLPHQDLAASFVNSVGNRLAPVGGCPMQDTRTEALCPLQKNLKKVLATTIGGGSMALFHYWMYGLLENGRFSNSLPAARKMGI